MNEIKIYLKPSGSTAELYKDFNLYQGSYRNVQISVYVPTSILYKNADNTFFNGVKTAAILTAPNGAKVTTNSFSAAFVKIAEYEGVEYAVYTQIMPKEYAMYSGTQLIVCNVFNIDNTDASAPKIISVTTSQRAPLVVLESAYLSEEEPLNPTEAEVIEGLISDLQERLNKGWFASRALYSWSSDYTYGAGEIVFYPGHGEYGVFVKSLITENKSLPYIDGELNSEKWQLEVDFDKINEVLDMQPIFEEALAGAQEAAAAAKTSETNAAGYADAAQQSQESAASSAADAENSANEAKETEQRFTEKFAPITDYIKDIQNGTQSVPKAVEAESADTAINDGSGKNIAEQFSTVTSDIEGLRTDLTNEAHFRGYLATNAEIQALSGTPNDYAYSAESGTVWIYQTATGWTDSGKPVPDQVVPKGTATPLMDGTAAVGNSNTYADALHVHPTDTTRASSADTANAYNRANIAYSHANNAYNRANSAYNQANIARNQANNAYNQANSAYNRANSAYAQANNAYNLANNAYSPSNPPPDSGGGANPATSSSLGTVYGFTAIGGNAGNYGKTALGYSSAVGCYSTAVGSYATATNNNSVAVGYKANINSNVINCVAIGACSMANNGYSAALGSNAQTNANGATALGNNAQARGVYSVAVGDSTATNNGYTIAVGRSANANGTFAIALGYQSSALLYSTVAIGPSAKGSGNNSIAIGLNAYGGGTEAIALGHTAYANALYATAIGYGAIGNVANSITLGNEWITSLRCHVNTITVISDERTKEDIELADTARCLADVERLPVKRYKFRKWADRNPIDNHMTGFIAQDLEKVFPRDVQTDPSEFPVLDEDGNVIMEDVLDENGNPVYEQIGEDEDGKPIYFETPKQREKTFVIEDCKKIAPAQALPTLWGAVQELSKRIKELESKIGEK